MMNVRWPLATLLIIAVQMVMGGVVVGKDAGFVCPDWPLCHGTVLPPLTGLVVLELVHRATALLVTALVIGIAIAIWRKQGQNRFLVRIATASVVSLFIQVIVGGLIVIWKLPGVTTTLDVINSMFLLGIYVILTMEVQATKHKQADVDQTADKALNELEPTAWMVMIAIGLAVLVGAIFRHTGASEALYGVNTYLASHGQNTMPSLLMSRTALMLHILSGVFAAVATTWFLYQAMRTRKLQGRAWALFILVCLQVVLGMVSLGTKLSFIPVTLHWSNSAVLVGVVTWTAFTAHLSHREVTERALRRQAVPIPEAGPAR
jgi:heme a synthase